MEAGATSPSASLSLVTSLVYDPLPLQHLGLQAEPVALHIDLFNFASTMLFLKSSSSQQMVLDLNTCRSSLIPSSLLCWLPVAVIANLTTYLA